MKNGSGCSPLLAAFLVVVVMVVVKEVVVLALLASGHCGPGSGRHGCVVMENAIVIIIVLEIA